MKQCITCKKIKPYSKFQKRKANKDGFDRYCKKCKARQEKGYRTLKRYFIGI